MADNHLSKDLMFLILQFLTEKGFIESVQWLEKEWGVYFNLVYFEERVLSGEWRDVETYLSGFTRIEENIYSMQIYFEIRKQKYLEALDRQDRKTAIDTLINELNLFEFLNEDLYKEITQLITLSNFRENPSLSGYGDTRANRQMTMIEIKKLLEINPVFRDKFTFPDISSDRLIFIINQSLNWQHSLCSHPSPNPDMWSLAIDHVCTNLNLGLALPSAPVPDSAPARTPDPALVCDLAIDSEPTITISDE